MKETILACRVFKEKGIANSFSLSLWSLIFCNLVAEDAITSRLPTKFALSRLRSYIPKIEKNLGFSQIHPALQ